MNPHASGLIMDAAGDLPVFTRLRSGLEHIAQRVRVRTLTHRGDWPLDTTQGVRWRDFLSRKPFDVDALAAELAAEWIAVPGVVRVEDLEATVDTQGNASISASLRTVTGETLTPIVTAPGAGGNVSIALGLYTSVLA